MIQPVNIKLKPLVGGYTISDCTPTGIKSIIFKTINARLILLFVFLQGWLGTSHIVAMQTSMFLELEI